MPDLNLSLSYFNHRKTKRLVAALGRDADVLPLRLWAYVGDAHPEDGKLIGYAAAEIESYMGWRGEVGRAVAAFVSLGWLDAIEGGYEVHDWLRHQGHLIAYSRRGKLAAKARWERLEPPENASSMLQALPQACLKHATSNAPAEPTVPAEPTELKNTGGKFSTEPPPGFPLNESQAAFMGERSGVPREKAVEYWNDLASHAWRDQVGPVTDFGRHVKLRYDRWKNLQGEKAATQSSSRRPLSTSDIRNVIQAKTQMMNDLKFRHASEVATGISWSNQEKRKEYRQLEAEISELTRKMASMA